MSVHARDTVLQRIRGALGHEADASVSSLESEWQALPRTYDQHATLSPVEILDLLEERLRDYDAEVARVNEGEVASAVEQVLRARGSRPTLRVEGFPPAWTPAWSYLTPEDTSLSARQLDRYDGVVTGATLAIAETGTLVLQGVPGQGRRAVTLVPDFHLCVVRARDVVQNVPEAFARLEATRTLPTTFVSGPSATADIEMTRIKGVHGPRFLHVLLVTD